MAKYARLLWCVVVAWAGSVWGATLPGFTVELMVPRVAEVGQTAEVGVRVDLPEGYHAYAPPHVGAFDLHWELPRGVSVAYVRYPAAGPFTVADEAFRGYAEPFVLRVGLKVADWASQSIRPLTVTASGIICSDNRCVPVLGEASGLFNVGAVSDGALGWMGWQEDVPTAPEAVSVRSVAHVGIGELVLAFLGGVLLNLMPCVFPVLGIKILSFARQGGESPARRVTLGLAYSVGIIVSLWALAGVFCSLRGAGEALGWGFQLQNPSVVWGLLVVMLAVAAYLSGLWRWEGFSWAGRASGGVVGALGSGALMVALASPCSGPFLGVAFGALVGASMGTVFGVMTAMGLGLALPYLLLAWMPSWVRVLPKPGAWMAVLEKILAWPIWGSSLYLLWVMEGQVGFEMALKAGLWALLAILGLWGAMCVNCGRLWRWAGLGLFVGAIFMGAPGNSLRDASGWTPAHQEELLKEGKIVLVDFGARWCVTCQVLETALGADANLKTFLNAHDVVWLKADWTNPSAEIASALASYGRASVPTFVLLRRGQAVVLPEIVRAADIKNVVLELEKTE
jgi:thiol:disulfide interchange protein